VNTCMISNPIGNDISLDKIRTMYKYGRLIVAFSDGNSFVNACCDECFYDG